MANLSEMNMSDLISYHNTMAVALGVQQQTVFKSLAEAREACAALEAKTAAATQVATTNPLEGVTSTPLPNGQAVAPTKAPDAKYDSSGKRGPTQGIGAYAKERILAGKNNTEILAEIAIKFPTAKTSASCIAYYRSALKKDNAPLTPVELRGKAEVLMSEAKEYLAKADELEKAASEAAAQAKAQEAAAAEQAQAAIVQAQGPSPEQPNQPAA